MPRMFPRPINSGGGLNMVDLSDLKLEFNVSIDVCGEMDWDEIVQYDGNVEDYVEDNLENLDKEYHVNEEGLNVFSEKALRNQRRINDEYDVSGLNSESAMAEVITARLQEEIVLQKDQLNTLSETVISLNEQLAQLRGN
jgi:hypothetical protein